MAKYVYEKWSLKWDYDAIGFSTSRNFASFTELFRIGLDGVAVPVIESDLKIGDLIPRNKSGAESFNEGSTVWVYKYDGVRVNADYYYYYQILYVAGQSRLLSNRLKDTFIENVVGDETEYPANGAQGFYWYIKGELATDKRKYDKYELAWNMSSLTPTATDKVVVRSAFASDKVLNFDGSLGDSINWNNAVNKISMVPSNYATFGLTEQSVYHLKELVGSDSVKYDSYKVIKSQLLGARGPGEFIENFIAFDGEFPDGGVKGDYWYVRGGSAFPEFEIAGTARVIDYMEYLMPDGTLREIEKLEFLDYDGTLREIE